MKELQHIREILKSIAADLEVLPAVGGAIQDLERPDAEEREDEALNPDERVFDAIFEHDPSAKKPGLYRRVNPLGRSKQHFFQYFLDGSLRSYFLGTALENERETPVHFAQIGACVLRRLKDGSVQREVLRLENILLVGKARLSEEVWDKFHSLASQFGVRLVDLTEKDIVTGTQADLDLRNMAAGKVRFAMRTLESETIGELLPMLSEDRWLIVDGSLLFEPILKELSTGDYIKPVVGVAKNFRKNPQFVFGRGPRKERHSIFRLLAGLESEHRTAAFSAQQGKVVFWYVRLREQRHLDYPLMGVIKVELANPTQEPVPSELIDRISSALVAERNVAPHGRDPRWHAHLYPIFLAECAVKESLLSRQVVQQFLKWR